LIEMCCVTTRSTHLSTWVSSDLKQRFADAAAHRGLSESAFLKRLVERALAGTDSELDSVRPSIAIARNARITIRLVPEDRLLLRERAAARRMPAASYVSTLVRAHLRALAPLPDRELEALGAVVTQLAAIGRNLNVIALAASSESPAAGPTQEHVCLMLRLCEATHGHVKGLVNANIISWEAGYAQAPHRT
jgi:hypothetical protein